jgi:hypothetical protein
LADKISTDVSALSDDLDLYFSRFVKLQSAAWLSLALAIVDGNFPPIVEPSANFLSIGHAAVFHRGEQSTLATMDLAQPYFSCSHNSHNVLQRRRSTLTIMPRGWQHGRRDRDSHAVVERLAASGLAAAITAGISSPSSPGAGDGAFRRVSIRSGTRGRVVDRRQLSFRSWNWSLQLIKLNNV